MKEIFLLIEEGKMLDKCFTYSIEDAELIFKRDKDWIFSDSAYCISEADYIIELDLNALENQSPEQ
jgi:hypothetical protein